MDPNLSYWVHERQSFLQRIKIWLDILDPFLLLASDYEIQKAHTRLASGKRLNEKDGLRAQVLSLSSVHADSGAVLPLIARPPAFFPMSAPLIVGSFLPHATVTHALFWQFLTQSYCAFFNYTNRNSSIEQGKKISLKQQVSIGGTVFYATCTGALPQILVRRLQISNPSVQAFFRSVLPIPLSAALAFFSVFTIRSVESNDGILLFDYNGNPVGISRTAGQKAVRETAFSRALLFGVTASLPNLMAFCLSRTRFFKTNPILLVAFRHASIAIVMGLMIPVSFSLFPQVGKIERGNLEGKLQAGADDTYLFYHRGL